MIKVQHYYHHRLQMPIQTLCTLIGLIYTLKCLNKQNIYFAYKVICRFSINFLLNLLTLKSHSIVLETIPFKSNGGISTAIVIKKNYLEKKNIDRTKWTNNKL